MATTRLRTPSPTASAAAAASGGTAAVARLARSCPAMWPTFPATLTASPARVTTHAAALDRAGQRLNMSVNISRYDLVNDDLPDYVDNLLATYGFPHNRLTLEITESALGGDADRVEDCVRRLRARGLRISIDDFGVGYSSISQLLRLALDELKIDQSFVFGLTSDPHAKAIVAAVIEVARSLEITTVAEGIENEEVFRLLQTMGADIGQGYLIARPLTPQRLDEYLGQPDRVCSLPPLSTPLSVGT